jgi:hypothetical protein
MTRDLSQRQFAAPQEAVKVIAEALALLRDAQSKCLSPTQWLNRREFFTASNSDWQNAKLELRTRRLLI